MSKLSNPSATRAQIRAVPDAAKRQSATTLTPPPAETEFDGTSAPSTQIPQSSTEHNSTVKAPTAFMLDRWLHAQEARLTQFLSPISLMQAARDWELHLANAPERRAHLAQQAWENALRMRSRADWIKPPSTDHRFQDPAWQRPPFDAYAQSFLLLEDWWGQATAPMPGVSSAHTDLVAFMARQILDMFAPSNFALSNPEVLRESVDRLGMNYIDGYKNWIDDLQNLLRGSPPSVSADFTPGINVAVTPGKVIFRNELMELIQYTPTTDKVRPEPILIIPAWIMKYYILDLSPDNSFISYLVSQGFTVFCVSWRNPDATLAEVSLDDYRRLGIMAALEAVTRICDTERVHACGYCLGGTLLAIAAAQMARDGDKRFATVTLLAAQTDFTEAGELRMFTDESQLSMLDDVMWHQGYLDSAQMAGAFQMLRANDLIWSRAIKSYLLGTREKPNDLIAWSEDATRMPYKMHSEYLHEMFLRNDLAEGRLKVDGRAIAISDIHAPLFVVGTETDHVAPWKSVYKINLLNEGEIRFVLTSGGHNAGIVSEPGHKGRHFRIATRLPGEAFAGPSEWQAKTTAQAGSWWPSYIDWLNARSGSPIAPPQTGHAALGYGILEDAPGGYVLK